MLRRLSLPIALLACAPAFAADAAAGAAARTEGAPAAATASEPWIDVAPTPYGPILIQQAPPPPYRDYQMNRVLSPEERQRWREAALPTTAQMMKMDARAAMNYYALKRKARPGLSFDAVVQSMALRANRLNLKQVGHNRMSADFRAVLGDGSTPRIEIFSFCDIAVARDLLRIIPEMAVFLPCRIVIMEDADRAIWIMTLDWDMTWLTVAGENMDITPELREGALDVRNKLNSVMEAAAQGDL